MALDMKKFLLRFVDEAREHIVQLGAGLDALESDPNDVESVNAIFRSAHTIKGSSRMLKLISISTTAHHLEDLLNVMRDGGVRYTSELGRLLYRGLDAIAALVELVANGAPLPEADALLCTELAEAAQHSLASMLVPTLTQPEVHEMALSTAGVAEPETQTSPEIERPSVRVENDSRKASAPKSAETVRVRLSKLDDMTKLMGEVVSCHSTARQSLVRIREIEKMQVDASLAKNPQWRRMQTLLREFGNNLRDDLTRQNLLVDELHSNILTMRMLPLAMVFDSVGRTMRALAMTMGKQIECTVQGADMELDRQIIDAVGEPIMHLLRNALDHGIEMPEQRMAKGKAATGKISLCARQDGAFVMIEIADDGNGIALAALREKLVKKKILSQEKVDALPDSEVLDFIFLPGFSTSQIITEISGRGVGLDVVKRCIVDELQGEISVDTQPGKGSIFSLRLPMSLALMRVLLVTVNDTPFGFSAASVVEFMRVSASSFLSVSERQVVVIRNEFVPVVSLAVLLGLPKRSAKIDMGVNANHIEGSLLLVVKVRTEKMAFVVEALFDERDMVVKPMPNHLRRFSLVTGMVTTGKDELVNILHVPGLFERARTLAIAPSERLQTVARVNRILVVDDSINTREIEKDVLEAHGYQVILAEDGSDGLRKAQENHFDAILTDVEMPNMDGFTLTEHLRQLEKYQHTPIIIITSRAKEEDKRRGIAVGADAYIVKGDFEQSSLVEILGRLLG